MESPDKRYKVDATRQDMLEKLNSGFNEFKVDMHKSNRPYEVGVVQGIQDLACANPSLENIEIARNVFTSFVRKTMNKFFENTPDLIEELEKEEK